MQSNPVNPLGGQRGIAVRTPGHGGAEYWARRPLKGCSNGGGAKAITHRIERRMAVRHVRHEVTEEAE